jgi:predicted secreted protein
MNYTWTLESVENGLATISANATIKNDPTMSKQAQGEMVREIKAVGQQAGTIVVDINTGWVQTVDMEQTYQSTVTVTGAPDTDQPQVQTVEMKSVETYRSL